ncbi:MAG: hypothetical protein OEW08_14800 [Gammaproteobacteria bacterium]|nr:hypothetical protein [Gammaproteobacteria bacterium]
MSERPVQYFSDEYLEQWRTATPLQIAEFLEAFRLMQGKPSATKLISIKIPEALLDAFRAKCDSVGAKYQTQIKALMQGWVEGGE